MKPYREPAERDPARKEPMNTEKFAMLIAAIVVTTLIICGFATCAYTSKDPSPEERSMQECMKSCGVNGMRSYAPSEQYRAASCVCNGGPVPSATAAP